MSIFTKRNALVGYVTLKALERRKQRRKRHALKLAAFVALGLVSAGVLAALVAVAVRRQRDSAATDEAESQDVAELDAELAEPASAA